MAACAAGKGALRYAPVSQNRCIQHRPGLCQHAAVCAVLCTNCEWVSNSRNLRCDVCGSGAVLVLATILDREDPTPPEPTSPLAAYALPLAA
jgi:hypothetical protein